MTPTRKGNPPPSRGPGRPVGTDSGRTREHLLRVARDVLAEEGFPKTTIREIAERANVNPALLHYYFGNKSGLHSAVVEHVGKRIQTNLESAQGSKTTARQKLRSLLHAYLLVLGDEPYVAQMLIHHLLLAEDGHTDQFVSQVAKPLMDGMIAILEEGITDGEFREFETSFLVSSIAANCLSFFLAGPLLKKSGGVDFRSRAVIESWAESVTDLVLNGILKR